jgi:release factor glutamine methyltransferase
MNSLYSNEEVEEIFFRLTDHHLQKSRAETVLSYNQTLNKAAMSHLDESTSRLCKGVPLQHLIGEIDFAGCMLNVCEGVLIPRPETESLVHWMAKEHPRGGKALDICTGSGCIALGFAHCTQAQITGWDFSKSALACASSNAKRNQIPMNIEQIDVFNIPEVSDTWDVIVSNPPYVLEKEKATMHTNVIDFEPHAALFVDDNNPIVFYDVISDFALTHLNPGGSLYFELNPLTADKVEQLLKTKGFTDIVIEKDLRGLKRMMRSKRR